jgi:hypothetical protein
MTRSLMVMLCLTAACDANEQQPGVGENQQAETTTSGTTTNSRFKGSEANATFSNATTNVFIDLFQDTSGSNGGGNVTETFLFYQYTVADLSSQVCTDFCTYTRFTMETGQGDIPNTDAQISSGSAHVSTSTSDPGFVTQRCTIDNVNPNNNTCTTGTAGTISVDWHRDGIMTTFVSGQSTTTSPGFTIHTGGTFTTNSAGASGSLPGNFSFTNYPGNLIINNSSFITHTFTRNH